ncbi:hypothetical protein GW17_00018586 [Ensete ventricosum]|nr:hypothetical protein GW17_00018586 [Ensete ventricosum]RZR76409.1 hypothetical protein BHM03_00001193 [Ensete ventricosum]
MTAAYWEQRQWRAIETRRRADLTENERSGNDSDDDEEKRQQRRRRREATAATTAKRSESSDDGEEKRKQRRRRREAKAATTAKRSDNDKDSSSGEMPTMQSRFEMRRLGLTLEIYIVALVGSIEPTNANEIAWYTRYRSKAPLEYHQCLRRRGVEKMKKGGKAITQMDQEAADLKPWIDSRSRKRPSLAASQTHRLRFDSKMRSQGEGEERRRG